MTNGDQVNPFKRIVNWIVKPDNPTVERTANSIKFWLAMSAAMFALVMATRDDPAPMYFTFVVLTLLCVATTLGLSVIYMRNR